MNRLLLAALLTAGMPVAALPAAAQDYAARVARVLKATPLIDGYNDWAEAQRDQDGDARWSLDLTHLGTAAKPYNTDTSRLCRAMVGGQFWSVYVSADLPGPRAG